MTTVVAPARARRQWEVTRGGGRPRIAIGLDSTRARVVGYVMGDSFTETTTQGWFSRIGGSIKGVLFGILLCIIGIPLLFWNEGRAVKRYKTLKEGAGAVVAVSADKVDSANEGKLVHLSGEATTSETLQDEKYGISANALRLRRSVEMYQWKESTSTEKK